MFSYKRVHNTCAMSKFKKSLCLIYYLFTYTSADPQEEEHEHHPSLERDLYRTISTDESYNENLDRLGCKLVDIYFAPTQHEASIHESIRNHLKHEIENITSDPNIEIFIEISQWPKTKIDRRDVHFSPYRHKEHTHVCGPFVFLELLCKSETFVNKINELCDLSLHGTAIDLLIKFINLSIKYHQNATFPHLYKCFFKTVIYVLRVELQKYQKNNDNDGRVFITTDFFRGIFSFPLKDVSFSLRYYSKDSANQYEFIIKNRLLRVLKVLDNDRERYFQYQIDLSLIHTSIDNTSLQRIQTSIAYLEGTKKYVLKGCYFFNPKTNENYLIDIYTCNQEGTTMIYYNDKPMFQDALHKKIERCTEAFFIYEYIYSNENSVYSRLKLLGHSVIGQSSYIWRLCEF